MSILKNTYNKKAVPALMKKFEYTSSMAVPRIEKVVINTGLGRIMSAKGPTEQTKFLNDVIAKDLQLITGQKPAATKARKSIAGFKLREGNITGAKTTLRGSRMYDFIDRLVHVVLPRSRDFRGLNMKGIDNNGNLTIGIKEHIFFPEISIEKVKQPFGLEITIVTTANTREEGVELFTQLGFPFIKQDGQEI